MENLNDLETSILDRISLKYPNIKKHIPLLKVIDREMTGVGLYVNFCYSKINSNLQSIEIDNGSISTNENIQIEGLKYGLGYEVFISDGKIKSIELITYGEGWDGKFNSFKFS
jgi:hypothetical protein